MDSDNVPTAHEPMTSLMEAAAHFHEMYVSFVEAGFTEKQALYLVACIAGGAGGDK